MQGVGGERPQGWLTVEEACPYFGIKEQALIDRITGKAASRQLTDQDVWIGPPSARQRYAVRPDAARNAFIETAPAEYRHLLVAAPANARPGGQNSSPAEGQDFTDLEDQLVALSRERDELAIELARARSVNDGVATSLSGLIEVLKAEGSKISLHE